MARKSKSRAARAAAAAGGARRRATLADGGLAAWRPRPQRVPDRRREASRRACRGRVDA
jgi:hypothetical protein